LRIVSATGKKGVCPRGRGKEGKSFPLESGLAVGTEPEGSSLYAGRLSFVSLGAVLKDLSHVHVAGIVFYFLSGSSMSSGTGPII